MQLWEGKKLEYLALTNIEAEEEVPRILVTRTNTTLINSNMKKRDPRLAEGEDEDTQEDKLEIGMQRGEFDVNNREEAIKEEGIRITRKIQIILWM